MISELEPARSATGRIDSFAPAFSPSPLRLCDLCRGRPARSIRRGELIDLPFDVRDDALMPIGEALGVFRITTFLADEGCRKGEAGFNVASGMLSL